MERKRNFFVSLLCTRHVLDFAPGMYDTQDRRPCRRQVGGIGVGLIVGLPLSLHRQGGLSKPGSQKELAIIPQNITFFLLGLLLLYFCAGWLVKGASSFARNLGLSPVVIGLTIVAFGTSAPELVVSVVSSIKGKSMIALGNVVGSNICNIALVLGATACIQPVKSSRTVVQRDIPIMLAVSLYLLLLSLNGSIGRIDGATLFGGIILYTVVNYYLAIRDNRRVAIALTESPRVVEQPKAISSSRWDTRWGQVVQMVVGIAGVVAGAQLMIESAVAMMSVLGVGEKFIGLTVVAFGTSLPELATSVVAALKKEMDISIGNLVGSNVFNILSVIGATALVRPIPIPGGVLESGLLIDYGVMMFSSALPWLLMRKSFVLSRKDGLLLLGVYLAYLGYLISKT